MSEIFTPKFEAALEELAKLTLTADELKVEFRKKLKDLGWKERMLNLYRVRDKLSNKFYPLKINKSQLKFLDEKTNKSIILKARQIGYTTISCVYALDRALFDGWNTGIMSHTKEHVVKIFEIVTDAYENFCKDWGEYYQPREDSKNANKLSWADTKASLEVGYKFQGLTVNFLHVSEAAFIPGARLINSLQAVPDSGEIVLESTPNGRGGFFYEVWQDWKANGPGCPYKGFFVPWFDHYPERPENYIPQTKVNWTKEELELKERHNLEDYHLFWRRATIREKCGNDSEQFDIQYPTDDISCFYSGASSAVPRSTLLKQEAFISPPTHIGYLTQEDKKIKLYEDKAGSWKFWKLPISSKIYSIGVDSSSGQAKDPCVIQVLDGISGEQVAEYAGFVEPDLFAQEVHKVAQFYNQAWCCIEENNHGGTVILVLKDVLRYPNLYRRQDFNSATKTISKSVGFYTSSSTKLTITDQMINALRDGRLLVHSDQLLSELSTFENVIKKMPDGRVVRTNKREAQAGCYDDRVMALAMAYEMMRSRPASTESMFNTDNSRPELTFDETGFGTYEESEHGYYF